MHFVYFSKLLKWECKKREIYTGEQGKGEYKRKFENKYKYFWCCWMPKKFGYTALFSCCCCCCCCFL